MKSKLLLVTAATVTLAMIACSAGSNSSSGAAPAAATRAAGQAGAATSAGAGTGGAAAPGQAGGRRFATIPVQAVTVVSGPLITDNDTAGTVTAVTQSQVAAQTAGVVSQVYRKQGDTVKKGAPVVQIDESTLKLAVANAQAALDNAKINLSTGQQTITESGPRLTAQLESAQNALTSAQENYTSQKAQYDLGGISASALDMAKSQLAQAQANVSAAQLALDQNNQAGTESTAQLQLAVDQASNALQLAQLNLQYATIRAPFDGQLAAVYVTPGMYLGLNTVAFLLVSTDKQINFSEPPADAPSAHIGDVLSFTFAGKSYAVHITQTPSAPINGVVPMTASVPVSIPVSYGTVGTITYKLTIGNGPQIPLSSLQSRANINFVYSIVNGKATEVPVIIVAEAGTTAVVRGLNAGDQVILNPPPGLLNGSTVQVVAAPAAGGQQAPATGGQQGQAPGGKQGQNSGQTAAGAAKPGGSQASGGGTP